MISKDKLISRYTSAIRDGNAAIFAGAGLSRASGYVDWKTFLRPFAEELNLDPEKETDLLSVAQYYKNESCSRASINQELLNAFSGEAGINENIEIITRLPISTYWTTNYDKLIEKGLEKANRKTDVKIFPNQLAYRTGDRDAVVYKMHGDVEHPASAVLTKDDYVLYDKDRILFKTLLKGDLLSKKFLFIGFSFEDPNLNEVLNQIHAVLDENQAEHYCIFRKVQKSSYNSNEDYEYAEKKQTLRIRDMARYGICVTLVDEYTEITEILQRIASTVRRNNIFISGSAAEYNGWGEYNALELSRKLAESLVRENFRITSGFGLGIGSAIINGALSEIYRSKYKNIDKYLCLRPFPQNIKDKERRQALFKKYREDMISDTGIAIFLFGNKRSSENSSTIIGAPGCWEEFEIARANGNSIIPIASTGWMAKRIFDEIKTDIEKYRYMKEYVDFFEKNKDIDAIVKAVVDIAKKERSV